eukprot:m.319999 g.319999  ORF g.319999 m.319999 type:complete len:639 (+) comp20313_c0_seq2:376-2292(+)
MMSARVLKSFTRQRSCSTRTAFVALFVIVGVTIMYFHQFGQVATTDLRRAVDTVLAVDTADDQMFKGVNTDSQQKGNMDPVTIPRLITRTMTTTTLVGGQRNDAFVSVVESTTAITTTSENEDDILDTTTAASSGSTGAMTCALLRVATDGDVCPQKGESCHDTSRGPTCVCDGECLGAPVIDDDDSILSDKNMSDASDTRSLSQKARVSSGKIAVTTDTPVPTPKATTVASWTAPVVSKRKTAPVRDQRVPEEQSTFFDATDVYADQAPTCQNRMEACADSWKPCCPGGKGGPMCSEADCSVYRKPGKPCLGIFMQLECAKTCGLCGNEDLVLSSEVLKNMSQVEDSVEELSKELRRRISTVLPAVTLEDALIGDQHRAWQPAAPAQDSPQQNTVILLTVSKGFVDFLLNWRAAALRINVTRFLVIAEDEGSFNDLKQYDGFKGNVILSPTPIATSENGFAYNSPAYNTMVGNRPRYIRTLLRMGINVLYADVDSVWLAPPFRAFTGSDTDIWIQSDADSPSDYPYHSLCTGFMMLRANPNVISLVFEWEYRLVVQEKKTINQEIFNTVARKSMRLGHVRITPLPFPEFPSGALMYHFPDWIAKQHTKPLVVHNNFMVGHETKKNTFIRHGMWYVDF